MDTVALYGRMEETVARINAHVDVLLAPASQLLGQFFTVLPLHMRDLFWYTVFFFALSALVRLMVAPRLIALAESRGVVVAEGTRKKWGHTVVSMVHAIITTTWTLYLLVSGALGTPANVKHRAFDYDPVLGHLFSFVAAYFVWDLVVCVRNLNVYGKGFLAHAVMALLAALSTFRPYMMCSTARYVLFESSTIFMNIHWVLEKLGHPRTAWYMVANDAMFLTVFTGVRLGYGSYLTWNYASDALEVLPRSPIFCVMVTFGANVVAHALNIYWFVKLVRNVLRTVMARSSTLKRE